MCMASVSKLNRKSHKIGQDGYRQRTCVNQPVPGKERGSWLLMLPTALIGVRDCQYATMREPRQPTTADQAASGIEA